MSLTEKIKQMLAEQEKKQLPEVVAEAAKPADEPKKDDVVVETSKEETLEEKKMACDDKKMSDKKDDMGDDSDTVVDLDPKMKKKMKMSEQVSALLEVEGLTEDFKLQAVTIFEAAVADKAIELREELDKEYKDLFEKEKSELESNIDGYLSEAVQKWIDENEVAIKSTFRTNIAESFMDGLAQLLAEHNVVLEEGTEDALEIACGEVDKLEEELSKKEEALNALQEEVSSLKAAKILESYKEKMTQTEFDRYSQLVESIKYVDESQYTKQLDIVKENFSVSTTKAPAMITEQVSIQNTQVVTEDAAVARLAALISPKK